LVDQPTVIKSMADEFGRPTLSRDQSLIFVRSKTFRPIVHMTTSAPSPPGTSTVVLDEVGEATLETLEDEDPTEEHHDRTDRQGNQLPGGRQGLAQRGPAHHLHQPSEGV
jgi:hypothetical protein